MVISFEPPIGFYSLVYVVCIVEGKEESSPTVIEVKNGETSATCSYLSPGSVITIVLVAAKNDDAALDDLYIFTAKTSIID